MCDDSTVDRKSRKDPTFGTKLIHAGHDSNEWTYKDVVPPISMSTIFNSPSPGVFNGFEYTRCGNPIRSVMEKCLTALDNAKYALAYSSGMAAISAVMNLMVPGDHLLCSSHVYGGTYRLINKMVGPSGIDFDFIDFSKTENIIKHIKPNTKVVWFECLSNPLMLVFDVKEISDAIHKVRSDIIVAVDNSFVTPYFQRPLELGIDIVMYSMSKYMNGHSDVIMGSLVFNNKDLYDKLYLFQYTSGNIPSSFDCYLVNRGLKTLEVRMKKHMENAMTVAKYLESHPKVLKVMFMGLSDHPQNEIIKKQFTGYTGIVTFYINGELKESTTFLESLKLFYITCSLGCYESLAALPCKMTHGSLSEEDRRSSGIHDNLLRLSIGLECAQDLINDLEQALQACGAKDKSQ